MKISHQETRHIAHLARVGIPDSEIPFYAQELSGILEYVDVLQSVDVSGTSVGVGGVNHLHSCVRQDEAYGVSGTPHIHTVLKSLQTDKGFVKVQAILDKKDE